MTLDNRDVNLPPGTWVRFIRVPKGVTVEEVRQMILDCTGVEIPRDRIDIRPYFQMQNVLVSFGGEHLLKLLMWAFQDDTLGGQPVNILSCTRKREF